MCCCFFFFKQKTAYEMRISDWSSDVCSSDLGACRAFAGSSNACAPSGHEYAAAVWPGMFDFPFPGAGWGDAIGRVMRGPAWGLLRRPLIFAWPCPVRSEEHTSELQSLMSISYAVFCLKKKKKQKGSEDE